MKRALPSLAWGVLAAIAAPACGLQLEAADAELQNSCSTAADCAGAGQCVSLPTGNTCVGTSASLPGLIIEVRPGQTARYGAGTSHLVQLDGVMEGVSPNGFVVDQNIKLSRLVHLDPGRVVVGPDFATKPCQAASDGSLPVRVQLRPNSPYVGLPLDPYSASTEEVDGSYAFKLDVPPGVYDIYIEPKQTDACEMAQQPPLPPIFYLSQQLDENLTLNIDVPPPSHLSGTLAFPDGESVDGWSLEVVEPKTGLVISEVQTLVQDPVAFQVAIDLDYYWLFDKSLSPVIRLRPKEGELKPRAHWELAPHDLFGTGQVDLTLTDLASQAKAIDGRVLDGKLNPVAAAVTIETVRIDGDTGFNASYRIDVDSNPVDGSYHAPLFLGTYRLIARPKVDPQKALAIVPVWKLDANDLGSGHDILIAEKTALRGRVITAKGDALIDVSIEATPPLPSPVSYYDKTLQLAPVLPDKATGAPGSTGQFSLAVDPGTVAYPATFDFSVRTRDGSGFPWFVRASIIVPTSGSDLGTLSVPYPAVLEGAIQDPDGGLVGGATIRAWLPVTDPAADGGTVIQIGETISDDAGGYVLALPPSILQ